MTRLLILPAILLLFAYTQNRPADNNDAEAEAQQFLDSYMGTFQKLYAASAEAEWALHTRIVEGDTMNAAVAEAANEALANFTGGKENIEAAKKYHNMADQLADLQIRQFKSILYGATVDWRAHLQSALGGGMSAKPMVDYYIPLMGDLNAENEGRTHTLPEQFPG